MQQRRQPEVDGTWRKPAREQRGLRGVMRGPAPATLSSKVKLCRP